MHVLMAQLFGARRCIVQGGDWGAGIAGWMAHDRPDALLGSYLNVADLLAADSEPTTDEERAFVARRAVLLDREAA